MNIVLLPSAYEPAVGGVEELTRRLTLRLVARGNDVEVWTFRHPTSLPPAEVLGGITVRRFIFPLPAAKPTVLASFPRAAWQAMRSLSLAMREFHPDVLHVQCFSAQGIYAAALAIRYGVPLIISLQGETLMDDGDIYEHSFTLRHGLRTALARAQAVTGCSAFVVDDAVRHFGLRPGRGRVVPNGVEPDGDDHAHALNVPFERFVLALGRAVSKKGFDLLVKAFAEIAAEHPDVGLVIAGDGPAQPGLETLVRNLGLENRVLLPGRLDRAQVAGVMAEATIFVLPSRVEPFGIVVLEALRARLPVVVSAHGGAREIVRHEREGLVVDPFDTLALAAAIGRLLGDTTLAMRLASAGQRRAEEFSWQRITDQYTALYDGVLMRNDSRARRKWAPALFRRQLPGAPAKKRLST